ncbi:helix-turn-helix domain-containing protein [Heyndrickxia coagulans]|uniref:Helix-turn-helix transcriptional regulator n=1 Tax=Heyndrickxia coagulans TaxID=1398 RepID=A0AAW7CF70_HEYCO|nr:helix-turn-helix transcriptional regulator [Heyndrickxia coagulans]MDL5039521.1 helix-turn-helix transcriptional regulator [Heyndrickxia coagulans]
MKLVVRLDRVLSDRNLTQKELAEMTGLRPASISELYNNQRKSLNREHIEKIAEALNIKNISELVELKEGGQ